MSDNKQPEVKQESSHYSFFDLMGSKGVSAERQKSIDAMAQSSDLKIIVWDKVCQIAKQKVTTQEQAAQAFYKIQGIFDLCNVDTRN